ncbi:hypothetical protein BDV35DRAFT_390190 [Aspergillus flavus]|uniref:Hydrophobin n=2 Tax=Aspergillus subgen. Circumdati TaxID=2720871 RepID=A0A1S9DK83_ASPOZ|nr:hypothetical protein BDV35DRAFT_390190 [Aspergillus flavus]KAJ1713967.1 hypothetical protein NYO67_3927 [Aspergillus flavus]OOO09483.1 hypothetical protein OAory_01107790 [Aspergillus oryzae]RAQ76527.1 hypothetical protein COH20_010342 [Aspergillus flavus]RAQ80316.1 hypothetical protein COH21_012592 [Aspergillus flavus]
MQFRSVIALVAFATAVTAAPCDSCDGGDSGDSGDSGKCSPNQELKCCTGLTQGLNLGILPALCLPLLANCNNQAACCEANGGLLNCLTIQL